MSANRRARARTTRAVGAGRALSEWLPYWVNELGARQCSPRTVENQAKCLKRLADFTGDVPPTQLTVETLEAWRDHLAETLKPSSTNRYVLTVGTFLNWLVAEGVLDDSPMMFVALLKVHDTPPPVFTQDVRRRLSQGAAVVKQGRSEFEAVRDVAMLSFLEDTGARASECAGILLANVDLRARQALIHDAIAKGGYGRVVAFGFDTARALARYMREREAHHFAFVPQLFVGRRGPATYTIVRDAVRKAGFRGGVVGARPHLYRHTFAHELKSGGASDEVLMSLAGWRTPAMLRRYGRAEQTNRALDAYRAMGSPVDRAKLAASESPARLRVAR